MLRYIYYGLIILCIIINIYALATKKKDAFLVASLPYFISILFVELIPRILHIYINTAWYNYYILLATILFSIIYIFEYKNKKIQLLYTSFSIGILVAVCIILLNNTSAFSTTASIIFCFFCIINALIWLIHCLFDIKEISIIRMPLFWFSTAFLFWGCFFLFRIVPANYFSKQDPFFLSQVQIFFNVINIITYILYLLALLCRVFPTK